MQRHGCSRSCRLGVARGAGAIKLNFPDLEPHEMPNSCALDIADYGGLPLEVVGEVMNVTRERIRQIEVKAEARLEKIPGLRALAREALENAEQRAYRADAGSMQDHAISTNRGSLLDLDTPGASAKMRVLFGEKDMAWRKRGVGAGIFRGSA